MTSSFLKSPLGLCQFAGHKFTGKILSLHVKMWLFWTWFILPVCIGIPIDCQYDMYQIVPMYWHMVRLGILIDWYVSLVLISYQIDMYHPYQAVYHDTMNRGSESLCNLKVENQLIKNHSHDILHSSPSSWCSSLWWMTSLVYSIL